ncbi:unnamed protein product [Allacma fusca]|uniref:Uncharacterized protein n=1 Tax=Allacma fusca TaxID=39272 RepID=A0A8J2L5W4_9HEXA|nr:unnamed protein product [Allacma fusca]
MPARGCCCCNKKEQTPTQIMTYQRAVCKDFPLERIDSIEAESDSLYSNRKYLLQPVPTSTTKENPEEKGGHSKKFSTLEDAELQFSVLNKQSRPMFHLSHLNLPSTKYSAVRALLFTLSALFGDAPEDYASQLDKSYFDIGGNADSTLVAIACLHHYKFKIDVLDFLKAKSLREIIMRMSRLEGSESKLNWIDLSKRYTSRKLKVKDLEFLFRCLKNANNVTQPQNFQEKKEVWQPILGKGNHLLFKKKLDKSPAGLVLNFDVNDDLHNRLVPTVAGASLTNADIQKHSFEMSSKSLLIELLQFVGDQSHVKGALAHPVFLMVDGLSEQDKSTLQAVVSTYNCQHSFSFNMVHGHLI